MPGRGQTSLMLKHSSRNFPLKLLGGVDQATAVGGCIPACIDECDPSAGM